MNILYLLALAFALGCVAIAVLAAFAALCNSIVDHWVTVVLCLALAALTAPFLVRDGFETAYLVVPFAFGLVMVPGLLLSMLVNATWRALVSAKRKGPARRAARAHRQALRRAWSA